MSGHPATRLAGRDPKVFCTPLVRVAHVPLLPGPAAAATSRALLLCPRGCGRLLLLRELGLREPEAIRLPRRGRPRRTRANADALHLAGKVPSIVPQAVQGSRSNELVHAGVWSRVEVPAHRKVAVALVLGHQGLARVQQNAALGNLDVAALRVEENVDVGNPEAPVVRGFFRSKAVDNRHVLLQVMVCELDPLGADGPEGIRTPEGCTPLR
mmetsp:Transcript_3752/g.13561  ORF Transcript_3752/g.13561 Transcript_3752/m.13561 type:complete len:212 (+) Transcript_3752:349-984(+)